MAVVYTITRSENVANNSAENQAEHYAKLNDDQKSTSYSRQDVSESVIEENSNSSSVPTKSYYANIRDNIIDNVNHRPTSIPYESLNHLKPEVYYISLPEKKKLEESQQSSTSDSIINETKVYSNSLSERKVTAYMITSSKDDESSDSCSLPSIRLQNKKHAASSNTADDNNRYVPNEHPIGPQDISANINYELLSQSKSSDSIRRSMNKQHFGDN